MTVVTDPAKRQQLYSQFLSCIDREEILVNHRMSWGLQWNIAAFASLFALGQMDGASAKWQLVASILIAASGVMASVLSYRGVSAAQGQVERLIKDLERRLGIDSNDDWKASEFLRPYGHERFEHKRGKEVAKLFPLVFIGIWVAVFLFYFAQIARVFFN